MLDLVVRDTGPGIDAEHAAEGLRHVPPGAGRQQPAAASDSASYIVKRFVEMLGGRIAATSRLGEGSSFRVSLPAGVARATGVVLEETPPSAQRLDIPSRRCARRAPTARRRPGLVLGITRTHGHSSSHAARRRGLGDGGASDARRGRRRATSARVSGRGQRARLPDLVRPAPRVSRATGRQLLAARAYLRAGAGIAERWSWTDEQIARYQNSDEYRAALTEIDKIEARFAELNPGYTLYVNTDVRSLDVQIVRWNENASVGAAARCVAAGRDARSGDLSGFRPGRAAVQRAPSAGTESWRPPTFHRRSPLPGLLAARRADRAPSDFQIQRGDDARRGHRIRSSSLRSAWASGGWTQKLAAAVAVSSPVLSRPAHRRRRRAWRTTEYVPWWPSRAAPASVAGALRRSAARNILVVRLGRGGRGRRYLPSCLGQTLSQHGFSPACRYIVQFCNWSPITDNGCQFADRCLPRGTNVYAGEKRAGSVLDYILSISRMDLAAVLMIGADPAHASHERAASISWNAAGGSRSNSTCRARGATPGAAPVAIQPARRWPRWRCTGPGGLPGVGDLILETIGNTRLNFGDGNDVGSPGPGGGLAYVVSAIDTANDWLFGGPSISSSRRWTRPSRTRTGRRRRDGVHPRPAAASRTPSQPPHQQSRWLVSHRDDRESRRRQLRRRPSSMPPIVLCPRSCLCTFSVPGADPDNDTITFRLSTDAEAAGTGSGHNFNQPGRGRSLGERDDQHRRGSTPGTPPARRSRAVSDNTYYSTQVTIEDRDGSNMVKSKIAVDFLILFVNRPGWRRRSPSPPAAARSTSIQAIRSATGARASDTDFGQTVTLNVAGLPLGATMTPGLADVGQSVSERVLVGRPWRVMPEPTW